MSALRSVHNLESALLRASYRLRKAARTWSSNCTRRVVSQGNARALKFA